jgi:hypothetical protein
MESLNKHLNKDLKIKSVIINKQPKCIKQKKDQLAKLIT